MKSGRFSKYIGLPADFEIDNVAVFAGQAQKEVSVLTPILEDTSQR